MSGDPEQLKLGRQEDIEALTPEHAARGDAAENDRPPLLAGPKRQHFLPRFYLDGFARDGMVAVFDREKKEIRQQQPVNTAVIGHFYTMEDAEGRRRFEIEALLADYEGKAKLVIDKLVASAPELTADERSDMSIFVALAATRTPEMVNSLQVLNGDLVKRVARILFADSSNVFMRLRADESYAADSDDELRKQAEGMVRLAQEDRLSVQTSEKWAVKLAIETALGFAPYLAARHWRILHRENEKLSFITTDSPVYLSTVAPRAPSIYGVGFGSPDAFVSFPLHQSCTLEMFGDGGLLEHTTVDKNHLRRINLHFARKCQRFVIGRDYSLVNSLANALGLANKKWQPNFRID